MAKKITIQHLYTTSGTTAPNDLINGEIAISHATGNEAIFLKPREAEPGKAQEEIKFIPEVRIKEMFKEAGIESDDVITGLTSDLNIHKNTEGNAGVKGHVELKSGDLSEITAYTVGHAAASYHEHSQYLEPEQQLGYGFSSAPGLDNGPRKYSVKEGTGITVNESGVSISDEYQGKIASGATAYGWGDHASIGYAKNNDLTAHTGNTTVHITETERTDWNNAKDAINAFMIAAESGTSALDTLKEIQEFLTSDDGTVQTLLDNLSGLTDTVDSNTTAITQNTNNITTISGDVKTISGRVDTLSTNVENIFENFVQTVSGTGSNIKVEEKGTTEKSYEISHTGPASATTKFEGTTTTGLAFGDSFKVVSNLGYDANGHVVTSATTASTFTLPELPTATTSQLGVSKLKEGDLSTITSAVESEAAASYHFHSQYVKFTDLYSGNTSSNITISCGTY